MSQKDWDKYKSIINNFIDVDAGKTTIPMVEKNKPTIGFW